MKGSFIAFAAVALFSLYAVFGKVLLQNTSPFLILVLNQVLAGTILILLLDLTKRIKELHQTSKKDMVTMYIISIFSAVGGPLLFLLGLNLTSATNSILIGKSEAVLTTLLAIYFLKDKITLHQVVGAIIMFFGVILIATQGFVKAITYDTGSVLVFFAALSSAIGTVMFKRYMHHIPPEVIVSLRNLFGASMLFVISLFLVDYSFIANLWSIKFVGALLGLVILTTILGQYLWYRSLEMTSASKVSMAGLSSPLIAVFYAVIFLGESLAMHQIVGGLCIIVGLIVLEFHIKKTHTKKKHKHHLKLKHWPHA